MRSFFSIILLLFNGLCISVVLGQKENNIWYFGDKAGLDFKSSPPTSLTNSSMVALGGTGTISDANGKLLFYTNGVKVWNKNHSIMTNGVGINGDSSNLNSGLIIKKPSSTTLYYVFSLNGGDIYYSIVDISLSSGLGSVTSKNNQIYNASDGSFTIAKHSNCNNYWLITRKLNSNQIQSYLISNTGISSSPIATNVGTVNKRLGNSTLQASPNNKRLGATIITGILNNFMGVFEIYNFNNTTGKVSKPISLPNIRGPNRIAFSPNSRVLYGTSAISWNNQLYQYDLSLPTDNDIINSQISLDSSAGKYDIQLASDGKIYAMRAVIRDSLDVITSPNNTGTSCNYIENVVSLSGRKAGFAFPRMLSSEPQSIVLSDSCETDTAIINLLDPAMYSFYSWNFGDSASGSNNSSSLTSPKHKFTGSGYYPIRFIGMNGCFQLDTILDTIYIEPLPLFNLGNDTSICNGDTILLDASSVESTYIWQDSTTDSTYLAFQDTMYRVEVTNGCGAVMDSILIDYRNFDKTDLGNDTSVCPGDSILLDASTPFATHYLWQNNSTDSSFLVSKQGTYSVEVGNGCDTLLDTVDVFYINPPAINLGRDTSRCSSDSITLSGKLPAVDYLWYNGDTTQAIITQDTGLLWVNASNFRCSARDSIYISIYDSLFVDLGNDTTLCDGQSFILDVTQNVSHPVNYLWHNGSTLSTIIVNSLGIYSVKVSDYCGILTDSIVINREDCYDGIKEEQLLNVQVFPNPFKDILQVQITNTQGKYIVKLLDLSGKIMLQESIQDQTSNLEVNNIEHGFYILQIEKDDRVMYREKVIRN